MMGIFTSVLYLDVWLVVVAFVTLAYLFRRRP